MEDGQLGLSGPTVHLNVTLAFKFESDSVIHLQHCMVVANARVRTSRPGTVTPTPARVLLLLFLQPLLLIITNKTTTASECHQCVSTRRCMSTGDDVHDSSWMWGSGWCMSTGVLRYDGLRGAVCHLLLWWLLLCPGLLPVQQKLCASVSVSMLPPGGDL